VVDRVVEGGQPLDFVGGASGGFRPAGKKIVRRLKGSLITDGEARQALLALAPLTLAQGGIEALGLQAAKMAWLLDSVDSGDGSGRRWAQNRAGNSRLDRQE
jgi:hypothetical protein